MSRNDVHVSPPFPVLRIGIGPEGVVSMVGSPMLSRADAAFYLGVSVNTLDGLRGLLKRGRGHRKYHVADLDAWLKREGKLA